MTPDSSLPVIVLPDTDRAQLAALLAYGGEGSFEIGGVTIDLVALDEGGPVTTCDLRVHLPGDDAAADAASQAGLRADLLEMNLELDPREDGAFCIDPSSGRLLFKTCLTVDDDCDADWLGERLMEYATYAAGIREQANSHAAGNDGPALLSQYA